MDVRGIEDGWARYVVQRHRARALHYDLRLEHAGVLLSWAVPKGPTLDPTVRRLAVQVGDHDLSHLTTEGAAGGGDTIVWDWGRWRVAKDQDTTHAIAAGDLHFDLEGEKLGGRFALVRREGPRNQPWWLLVHKRDGWAEVGFDAELLPRSVLSGRTNDEVAAGVADIGWRLRTNRQARRYELVEDGAVVAFADYVVVGESSAGVVEIPHTEVLPERRGEGIGTRLVSLVLAIVRAEGLRIVPTCWFVADHFAAHPEERDLCAL